MKKRIRIKMQCSTCGKEIWRYKTNASSDAAYCKTCKPVNKDWNRSQNVDVVYKITERVIR